MKRIAIFCDGTWNSKTMDVPTHVVRLSEAYHGVENQVVEYQPGVGTDKEGFRLNISEFINKYGGGALGWGLAMNVKLAYKKIVEHYEPDDEIYIFGFSRGAYTARSLAGMIRKCGIIPRDKLNNQTLNRAFALYRKGGDENRPSADHIRRERLALSPVFATDADDLALRGGQGHLIKIAYLGVWDTVGALGVPDLLGPITRMVNFRHKFHDTELSSLVKSARHAVALDEHRVLYSPALWGNLDHGIRGKSPLNGSDTSDKRPYQQSWFIGDHGVVGGSNPEKKLTGFSLEWIAQGAAQCGLKLNPSVQMPEVIPDALVETDVIKSMVSGALQDWRTGPQKTRHCHPSVAERLRTGRLFYAPESLKTVVADLLNGW